jgi:hypothetical protein
MTRSEEVAIINRRIPQQENYIADLKKANELADKLLWTDVNTAIERKRRLKELLASAEGALRNLVLRRDNLRSSMEAFPFEELEQTFPNG